MSETELTFNGALVWCMVVWAIAYVFGKLITTRRGE
jgi:membrane protein DedA with SNARE-associated domain